MNIARRLVSLSHLIFCKVMLLFSTSSACLSSSPFSATSFFLADSKSERVSPASSHRLVTSARVSWADLFCFSMLARSLATAS